MELGIYKLQFDDGKKESLPENLELLFSAAVVGDEDKIKQLEPQIDINAIDYNGMTALHHAAIHLHLDLVRYLVSIEGIDATIEDKFGRSASWATLDVNGQIEEAMEISDFLEPYCYPTAHSG